MPRDQAGRRENSFQQSLGGSGSVEGGGQILPSAVLDTNDELTNLYKTISRKQILSKVQCSSFSGSHHHPHHLHHQQQQQAQSPENSRDSR